MRKLLIVFVTLLGCEKANEVEAPDVGSFFSGESLQDSVSADDKDVECAGSSEKEQNDLNHPSIIRGSVFAPPEQQTSWSFFNAAYAVPIEGEVPRAGIQVTIGDDKKTWRETTTDPLGRFCLRLPFSGSFGSETVLTATVGDDKLRRFAPTRHIAIISAQSEAVVRIASPLLPLSPAELINLQTMADTRSDLTKPIAVAADIQSTVLQIQEDLQEDPRIGAWLSKRMTKE